VTQKSLQVGLILSALVFRVQKEFITVHLDSGIEAVINMDNLVDNIWKPSDVVKKGQIVTGVVVQTKLDFDHDELIIALSLRLQDLKEGDRMFRRVQFDEAWDHARFTKDTEMMDRRNGQKPTVRDVSLNILISTTSTLFKQRIIWRSSSVAML
jgi:transcription elongation factor SPT6